MQDAPKIDFRLAGLRRFAVAITILNVLGHTVLGFEQSWLHPVVALATAYLVEILLEWLAARGEGRAPRYRGSWRDKVDFLLPAHISALAVAMLLYTNSRLEPVVFATTAALASKHIFRTTIGKGRRHYFNPSNFGISLTLILLPWVGIAQPYMFTENLHGWVDWLLPAVIVCTGTFLNARFTRRLPLIAAWLGAFVLQALLRSAVFEQPFWPCLAPMTGVAFLLFTFYMVTDPATTPMARSSQIAFGAGVGLVYGVLMAVHVVFGLFFALSLVCTVRGVALHLANLAARETAPKNALGTAAPVAAGRGAR